MQGVWTGYSSPLDRTALKKRKYLDGVTEPAVETPEAKPSTRTPDPASPFADKLRGALSNNVTGNKS